MKQIVMKQMLNHGLLHGLVVEDNPFDHHRPVHEDHAFLDRTEERKRLRELVLSKRNLLVYGLRRRGKSSLIQYVLRGLPTDHVALYVDAQRCRDDEEVGLRLLAALAATRLGRRQRFLKWCREFLGGLALVVDVGGKDAPVSFRVSKDRDRSGRAPMLDALEFIGRVADAAGVHIVVAVDEFQVVVHRGGQDTLWGIRSVAQFQTSVSYVISGSEPSLLQEIVSDPKNAFWHQLTEFPVHGLTIGHIQGDVERIFGAPLPEEAKGLLQEAASDNTQRLSQVLRHAFDAGAGIEADAVRSAIQAAVHENAPEYEREMDGTTSRLERELLFSLARNPTTTPTGSRWLRECGIEASPSGAHQALRRLRQKQILDDKNRFADPLFAAYLA